nr:kinesin-like protein KIN-14C [Tanacetum cinerariifolium]
MPNVAIGSPKCTSPRSWGVDSSRWKQFDEQSGTSDSLGEELSPCKFQMWLRSPMISEPTSTYTHHVGHKFHEVFQMKHGGGYSDLPASKISTDKASYQWISGKGVFGQHCILTANHFFAKARDKNLHQYEVTSHLQ